MAMNYRQEFLASMPLLGSRTYTDIFSGDWYQQCLASGTLNDDDVLLMFSVDGAQLYEHKASDCWIYIWVILDLSPDQRYKKYHVIPGGFIPGPGKLKNLDSFLFPGLFHIAALQCEGFCVYNALTRKILNKRPLIALASADAPGMAQISGYVGHNGAKGCRKMCKLPGCRKDKKGTYYPLCQKPENYSVDNCSHGDISLHTWPVQFLQHQYNEDVLAVMNCHTLAKYNKTRRATGIVKPSIFSGIQTVFGAPGIFPLDSMHLLALNVLDLLLSLWHGTLKAGTGDDKETWDWAVLKDKDIWEEHGTLVQGFQKHLPSEYDCPPRNPAEKINSSYKAAEYLTYIYGYLPLLL
ncbi:hypothetical protein P691DRAFT_763731 [Macrolepiota fuliginosa MF-IS2]|uniref:Uncharacterized protein n=1 Tax=Macrolepiota fuliginosa MF-IS2 TaxID=1400762 RepID=A0A9P5X6H0_9AGAR|nr:hypothetical protein P691DRAFT_763731 [Macrolepiota fuliginosa MF-IS2]